MAVEKRVILADRRAKAQRSLVGPFLVLRGRTLSGGDRHETLRVKVDCRLKSARRSEKLAGYNSEEPTPHFKEVTQGHYPTKVFSVQLRARIHPS